MVRHESAITPIGVSGSVTHRTSLRGYLKTSGRTSPSTSRMTLTAITALPRRIPFSPLTRASHLPITVSGRAKKGQPITIVTIKTIPAGLLSSPAKPAIKVCPIPARRYSSAAIQNTAGGMTRKAPASTALLYVCGLISVSVNECDTLL